MPPTPLGSFTLLVTLTAGEVHFWCSLCETEIGGTGQISAVSVNRLAVHTQRHVDEITGKITT